jgi:hypothetical protein
MLLFLAWINLKTVQTETIHPSVMSVNFYWTAESHIPDGITFQNYRCENLITKMVSFPSSDNGVRFPMRSLDFSIDLILPAAL